MYYEEIIIGGVTHYWNEPDDKFKPYDLKSLSSRYKELQEENWKLREDKLQREGR